MKFHALIGFSLVCLLACGAAEAEDDSDFDFTQQEIGAKDKEGMEKFCKMTPDELAKLDANPREHGRQAIKECMAAKNPEMEKATVVCQTEVYGSTPKTSADRQKVLCAPDAKAKQQKFRECMKGKNVKKPSKEELQAMRKECMAKKG